MFADRVGLNALSEQRTDRRTGGRGAKRRHPPVGKIPQAWAEPESQHRVEGEHVISSHSC